MTESRNYHGFDPDGVANTEADHFSNCAVCRAYTTCATFAQMFAHVHDAEIEKVQSRPARGGPLYL